ncbi:protein BUNDLE SHEATH DEFECTIVE 2, chloroplastic-like isoform X3 [Rhodamnia argentea]|uniref:Protein BUNDLE SHEATH DEFECTIVE 2, chloroplastic-like isoform X3 n=1 Tax=Rhodamnia argentea TaxID=178133 RepID=A0A8B8N0D6_9MYRT|nr:protein BUNDLE SHEATH DEFECTIVE 2, chloroplastic-like isoform X3 [Rhodamnia argentea]
MASALWSSPSPSSLYENQLTNLVPAHKVRPRDHGTTHHHHPPATKFRLVKAQAAKGDGRTKPKSMICSDCDGNGAVLCSQCKGSGVNSEDLFNGQFKAGDSCWLCGGRKHMLCGNCNGAGFIGGFMSTYDE